MLCFFFITIFIVIAVPIALAYCFFFILHFHCLQYTYPIVPLSNHFRKSMLLLLFFFSLCQIWSNPPYSLSLSATSAHENEPFWSPWTQECCVVLSRGLPPP